MNINNLLILTMHEQKPLISHLCAIELYLNPWVQREYSVQDIDSNSVIKIRSHTLRSGENFYMARRIKSLCDVPR
jgi:hypothetical protein